MCNARDIDLWPIGTAEAEEAIRRLHYSGRPAVNAQLNVGVYLGGKLEGAMQFGPSMDKRKLVRLVAGTKWNGFLELNRMAFSDALPRNRESRALGICLRMLRKHAPHLEWVVSYSDATGSGDGTIYRASGFVLTGIRRNTQIWEAPDGTRYAKMTLTSPSSAVRQAEAASKLQGYEPTGGTSMGPWKRAGMRLVPGYQLRYVYFLNPAARRRLTVPEIPFDEITRRGASMYLGKARTSPPCRMVL